jgi:O-acetyl-ADP-ribose deacetylase (regulator of RNase III)
VIRVLRAAPDALEADAILRSVGADLEACTALERRLGVLAGPEVLTRLGVSGEVPVGGALVTPGGGLPVSFLIHVVIRSSEEGITEHGIRRALVNGLRQAEEWGLGSITVLPLGIGAGNLEAEDSARVMLEVLRDHFLQALCPRNVTIAVATEYEEDAFRREAARFFPEYDPEPDRPGDAQ